MAALKIGTRALLIRPVPEWEASTLAKRLGMCRVLLSVHGYLRDSENTRIARKLKNDFERGM